MGDPFRRALLGVGSMGLLISTEGKPSTKVDEEVGCGLVYVQYQNGKFSDI